MAVWVGGSLVSVPRRTFFEDRVLGLKRGCCCAAGESFSKSAERGVEGTRQEGSRGGSGTFGSGENCVACEAISAATLSMESKRLCAVETETGVTGTKSTKGPFEPLRLPGVALKTE